MTIHKAQYRRYDIDWICMKVNIVGSTTSNYYVVDTVIKVFLKEFKK